jgi:glycosyltransferase involved in cell wall biosynthesis
LKTEELLSQLKIEKTVNTSPILSIITVVWNGEKTIEQTILSVLNQDYQHIEYIIIDGGSTDKTLQIITKYKNSIAKWICEPDNGIYDAMNKGISLATGDWVNFMNAGDEFAGKNVCSLVAEQISLSECDIIYGDMIAKDTESDSEILIKAKPVNQIWKGMVCSHQSSFIKRSDLLETPFNLKYKIASDYNQLLSLYTENKQFVQMPVVIARASIGGLSYSNSKTYIERIKIIHNIRPFSPKILHSIFLLIPGLFRYFIGVKTVSLVRKYKWKYFYS